MQKLGIAIFMLIEEHVPENYTQAAATLSNLSMIIQYSV
jgi:hypothetical protein